MLRLAPGSARLIALAVPAALLGGAYISQYGFGLFPCEMCWWQRYPHFAALVLAGAAFLRPAASRESRLATGLAGLAILISGLIGGFHAGVEYGWWQGLTACTSNAGASADPLQAILDAPLIRCDVPQWTLMGVSLAGWNFVFSCGGALAVLLALGKERQA